MISKKHVFNSVVADRKKGLTLSHLSKKYNIAKSTVSLWCKDVEISAEAKELIRENWLLATMGGRAKGTLKNKEKRVKSIEEEYIKAKKVLGTINKRDLLIMGVGLYWAEGSKKETGSGFSFINSDHLMIGVMHKWLTEIMNIKKDQLIVNMAINIAHKEREGELLKFWSNLIDFPTGDFGNTTFIRIPHRRLYKNHLEYFGMLRIKVKSSAWLRRRISGMIKIFTEKMPV